MKILQVIDQLNVGGAERVLVDLSNILMENQRSVDVLTLVQAGPLRKYLSSDIRVLNLGRRNRLSPLKLFKLHKICTQYDIIHVHLRYNFRYVALASLVFGGDYRILLHDHFGDIDGDTRIPFALSFFLKRHRWFAGVSRPLVDWAREKIGLDLQTVFLLPNIIRKEEINTAPTDGLVDTVRILHVSNFREAKNHDFAFKLVGTLRRYFPIRVSFVGQVIDRAYLENLLMRMREYGIDDIAELCHDCDSVQSIANRYTLAIHTAYQESGPLVLIEYLAQNLPFVAYKTGEVSTQIYSEIPGFFVNSFEISDWIQAVQRVVSTFDKSSDLMQKVYHSLYSSTAYHDKVMNIYNKMMAH